MQFALKFKWPKSAHSIYPVLIALSGGAGTMIEVSSSSRTADARGRSASASVSVSPSSGVAEECEDVFLVVAALSGGAARAIACAPNNRKHKVT